MKIDNVEVSDVSITDMAGDLMDTIEDAAPEVDGDIRVAKLAAYALLLAEAWCNKAPGVGNEEFGDEMTQIIWDTFYLGILYERGWKE